MKSLLRFSIPVTVLLFALLMVGGGCSSSSDPAAPLDSNGGDDGGGGGGGGNGGGLTESDSTFDSIDAAVDAGELTPGEGLLYKFQSVYEPDLLPESLQGGSAFAAESSLEDDLIAAFQGLPPAEQNAIRPYLYPPFYMGSWWDLRQKRLSGASDDKFNGLAPNISGEILESWQKIDTIDGHVRVWYEAAATQPHAQAVADAISSTVWDRLTSLIGIVPMDDGDHGGSPSRYDFVVADLGPGIYGLCKEVHGFLDVIPSCDETPTYIEVNTRKSLDSVPSTVAHEFMHALQRSLPFNGCDEYRWLREATATWVMDYCYPNDDFESRRIQVGGVTLPRHFLDDPERALDSWSGGGSPYSYGAYLFFQYLSKGFSPNWIRAIWENANFGDSVLAIDEGLRAAGSTDLEERWPQFSRFLWNQGPVTRFEVWDDLFEYPALAINPVEATLTASDYSDSVRLDVSLPRLSSSYFRIGLLDDSVSGFFFVNGWTFEISSQEWDEWGEPGLKGLRAAPLPPEELKGRSVELLYLVPGYDWVTVDLTESPAFTFCREVAAGRVEEAMLVFANGDIEAVDAPKEPLGLAPFLWFDNVGCNRWTGTLSWDAGGEGSIYRIDANYSWETGAEQAGGFFATTADDDLENWNQWSLEPVAGSMTWTTSSSDGTCTYQGDATWPVDEMAVYDQLLLRNFVIEGDYERTLTALILSTQERLVTEVSSGSDPSCGGDFTYELGAWLEIPHDYPEAKISNDGGRIDVIYQLDEWDPVFELHLQAQR